jgi:hypothetical protein
VEVPIACTWESAGNLLADLLREPQAGPRESDIAGINTFLAVMRVAGLSTGPSFRSPFLHNGEAYELRTHWRDRAKGLMRGEIRNRAGSKTADFDLRYEPGGSSGIPVHIDYQARSFLKLTFEADSDSTAPVPELLNA